jgi:N-acetyl-gamma-glutamylphosphate reductase
VKTAKEDGMLKVCLAGATGWAGSELARGIAASDDLELVTAVSQPYVDGALVAIRKVSTLVGVHRGLDAVLDL